MLTFRPDMKRFVGKCVNPSVEGRSVLITCQDRDTTTTVTVSHSQSHSHSIPETTTLMLAPHDHYYDCDHHD